MTPLIVKIMNVCLLGFNAEQQCECTVTHIRARGEWGTSDLVIVEAQGDTLRRWSSFYWPDVAVLLGLEWGSFTCIERNNCPPAPDTPELETSMIELVYFEPVLRLATKKGAEGELVRYRFAAPVNPDGKRNVRSAKPIGPYLAWVLGRAKYDVPRCYLEGEPPEWAHRRQRAD